jgi:hypothetical protein
VILVLGILAGIAVPIYFHFIEQYKSDLYEVNHVEVSRQYEQYMDFEQVDHSPVVFEEFLREIDGDVCPVDDELSFVDGHVKCSVHSDGDEDEDDVNDDGVPYL